MHQRTHPTTYANAILVLGMHRSGTSAVAGLLGLAGANLGEERDLLPAHTHDNPAGYWERQDIVAAHDAILDANGYKWDRIAGFDPTRLQADSIAKLHERVGRVLGALASPGRPLLVKDPRLCLLLPHWLPLLDNPACIVVVRDPREIAASMRNGPRGVYTSHYLIALWEKYLRTALATLNGRPALFIDYATLLNSPETQYHRLASGLTALGINGLHEPDSGLLRRFVDRRLQRSQPIAHVQLSEEQESLRLWLRAQCDPAVPRIVNRMFGSDHSDKTLREFERILTMQAELIAERDTAIHDCESAVSQRDSAVHERNLAASRSAETIHQYELAITQRDTAIAQNVQTRNQLETAEARIREQNAKAEEALRERSVSAMKLAEVTHQRNIAASELDNTRHERNVAAAQHHEAERHARELDVSIQQMRASWSWKLTTPMRWLAGLFSLRLSTNLEQGLYRAYYALPGLGPARKRAFILWLHSRAAWLTHNTLSYRLARQTPMARIVEPYATITARMDQVRADAIITKLKQKPQISVVMPVYNVERRWLLAAIESVRGQYYPHWQLCIADDASTKPDTRSALDEIERLGDKRIRITRLTHNAGIAAASNAALQLASGEYVGLLDHDDELTRDALLEVALCVDAGQPDMIYSDEDKLDEAGAHVEVHCKPDYSPDYFFSINYLCHFSVFRRVLLEQIGGFRQGFDGAQDYDLQLRATEHTDKIAHIPKVLYHWRRIPGSTASAPTAKPQTSDAGRRAVAESMQRRGVDCTVEAGPYPNTFRVRRKIVGEPLLSILIPFRDKPELLRTCISSVLNKTCYPNYEIVCIDNGSTEPETHALLGAVTRHDARVRVIRHDAPFNFSAINNFAASQVQGEHLLFLNNDTEIISGEWLDAMLEHSQRPEVGVVGARLWYADDTIQHAGVIVGPGGVAGHGHLFQPGDDPGYFARIRLVQNLSAVTFACAMTRHKVFDELGGLNEKELRIAFNDVDYCLRAREAGYLVVYTPYALLHHYESKSRGYEDTPEKQIRFATEIRYMQERHKTILGRGDPYYNPGLLLNNAFTPDPAYVATLPR